MKQLFARFVLPVFAVALLLLLGDMPRGAQPISAAPLPAITGTPTEPPTRTPTTSPNTPTPTAAAPSPTSGPPPAPTNTPKPSKHKVADPAITKSASPSEVRIGDEVTFTISVKNLGNETAKDVVVSDSLADYLDLGNVSASRGDVSINGKTVTVTIGDLAPGETVTIRISTRVNDRAQPPTGRNGATVTTSSPTDDPSNNSAEVTFTIIVDLTPTATLAPTVEPTAVPIPARLPPTGDEAGAISPWLVAAIGLLAIALSLLVRRRWSR